VTIKHSVASLLSLMGLDEFPEDSPAADYVSELESELSDAYDATTAYIYLKRNGIASVKGDGTNIISIWLECIDGGYDSYQTGCSAGRPAFSRALGAGQALEGER
jgi:hypothetical protein